MVMESILKFIPAAASLLGQYLKSRKTLIHSVSKKTIIPNEEELGSDFQLLFKGEPVKKVELVEVKLTNTGNQSIKVDDFEKNKNIRLQFGESSRVLDADIKHEEPDYISTALHYGNNHIELEPLLLNQKDSITVRAFVCSYSGKVEVQARIADFRIREKVLPRYKLVFCGIGLVLFTTCLLIVGFAPPRYVPRVAITAISTYSLEPTIKVVPPDPLQPPNIFSYSTDLPLLSIPMGLVGFIIFVVLLFEIISVLKNWLKDMKELMKQLEHLRQSGKIQSDQTR